MASEPRLGRWKPFAGMTLVAPFAERPAPDDMDVPEQSLRTRLRAYLRSVAVTAWDRNLRAAQASFATAWVAV